MSEAVTGPPSEGPPSTAEAPAADTHADAIETKQFIAGADPPAEQEHPESSPRSQEEHPAVANQPQGGAATVNAGNPPAAAAGAGGGSAASFSAGVEAEAQRGDTEFRRAQSAPGALDAKTTGEMATDGHESPLPPAVLDQEKKEPDQPIPHIGGGGGGGGDAATAAASKEEQDSGDVKEESRDDDDDEDDDGARREGIVEESPRGRFQRFEDVLGKGAFKTVYKAYDSVDGCEVAWNMVRLNGVPEREKKQIVNEIQLLHALSHPHILAFRGTWMTESGEVIFITENLSAGSLKSFINKVKVIRWNVVKRWCRDILAGLEYLHTQDPPVIHRDLKCDNIFINGQRGDLRIGDLGLSRRKLMEDKKDVRQGMTLAGTPAFMAPEFYDEHYDEKVDIYAFGMCTLEMLTKECPYQECTHPAQIMKCTMEGVMPKSLERVKNALAQDFISKCLQRDPKNRVTALELKDHDFLKPNKEQDNSEIHYPQKRKEAKEKKEAEEGQLAAAKAVNHNGDTTQQQQQQQQQQPSPPQQQQQTPEASAAAAVAEGQDPVWQMPDMSTATTAPAQDPNPAATGDVAAAATGNNGAAAAAAAPLAVTPAAAHFGAPEAANGANTQPQAILEESAQMPPRKPAAAAAAAATTTMTTKMKRRRS